jgi:5-methyltetrahydrofolate--homocysteine methyltransferase
MQTIISSQTKTIIIGPDRPFTIIGERINPTGRKMLAAEMAAGDLSRVAKDALAQVAAGAHVLDVNAGIPMIDEPAVLAEAIQLVQSVTDTPISIDSSVIAALQRGLEVYQGKALVNSVTGEDERLEAVLPSNAPRTTASPAKMSSSTRSSSPSAPCPPPAGRCSPCCA